MKQIFIIEMETDGMDSPSDMKGIEQELNRFFPYIAVKYVGQTKPATITWKNPITKATHPCMKCKAREVPNSQGQCLPCRIRKAKNASTS